MLLSDSSQGQQILTIRNGTFSWEEKPHTPQSVNEKEDQHAKSKGALLLKKICLQVEKVNRSHKFLYNLSMF